MILRLSQLPRAFLSKSCDLRGVAFNNCCCFHMILGAQKATGTNGSHMLVPRPNTRGISETMFCWILVSMWSLGPCIRRPAAVDAAKVQLDARLSVLCPTLGGSKK